MHTPPSTNDPNRKAQDYWEPKKKEQTQTLSTHFSTKVVGTRPLCQLSSLPTPLSRTRCHTFSLLCSALFVLACSRLLWHRLTAPSFPTATACLPLLGVPPPPGFLFFLLSLLYSVLSNTVLFLLPFAAHCLFFGSHSNLVSLVFFSPSTSYYFLFSFFPPNISSLPSSRSPLHSPLESPGDHLDLFAALCFVSLYSSYSPPFSTSLLYLYLYFSTSLYLDILQSFDSPSTASTQPTDTSPRHYSTSISTVSSIFLSSPLLSQSCDVVAGPTFAHRHASSTQHSSHHIDTLDLSTLYISYRHVYSNLCIPFTLFESTLTLGRLLFAYPPSTAPADKRDAPALDLDS